MRTLSFSVLASAILLILSGAPPAHSNPPYAGSVGVGSVPYYGATYGPAAGFSQADAKRVIELLEGIQTRLDSIDGKVGGVPVGLKKLDALTVAKSSCITCHTPSRAEKAGGDFILFSDDKGTSFKPLSGRDKARIQQKTGDGTMPPNKELKADEKSAFKW